MTQQTTSTVPSTLDLSFSTSSAGSSPQRLSAVVAATSVTALACAVVGVLQVSHEPSSDSTVVGVEHVIIGCLSLILLAQLPLIAWLTRGVDRHWPAVVAGSGMVALASVATQSNIQGHDPSYFAAMALPANALWFTGLIACAVTAVRRRQVTRVFGVLLPFTWVALIPLSSLGGAVLAAAYFAVVARYVASRPGHLTSSTPGRRTT